jgi:phytoene desaturase
MKVVVIGAGIGGLATAALLAKQGHEVTVVEAQDAVGGRAGTWEHEGFRFDTGPSWYLMPDVFEHFFALMGTSAADQLRLLTLDPGYRVFFEGRDAPLDIAATRAENVALFESVEKGAGARLDRYLDSAADTYRLAVDHFLYTTFQKLGPIFGAREVRRRAVGFLRLLLGNLNRFVARRFRDPRLRQILGYPAVFLGSSPYETPAMYHLMSHLDLDDGVLYPMGGFTRVIESIRDLAVAAGAQVITGRPVTAISVIDGRVTGVETDAGAIPADVVVSGADLHHSETALLPRELQTYPEEYWTKRTPGPGALLIYLGIDGEVPELEHHTLLFTREWKRGFDAIFHGTGVPDPASLYVCKPSGVDPSTAPAGTTNLFVLVPIPSDPAIGRGGEPAVEALADQAIAQIESWTGASVADRVRVRRVVAPGDFETELHAWKGTALGPAHTLRQSAFFRAGNASKKVAGLYYVGGSTIPGIGLPMCLISAELVVKRLAGDTSSGPLASL